MACCRVSLATWPAANFKESYMKFTTQQPKSQITIGEILTALDRAQEIGLEIKRAHARAIQERWSEATDATSQAEDLERQVNSLDDCRHPKLLPGKRFVPLGWGDGHQCRPHADLAWPKGQDMLQRPG